MRALVVIILLATLVLPSGQAHASPPSDTSTADLQTQATQGVAEAQNNLGGLYEFGHGVKQDSVRAFMWYNVAASLSTNDPQKDVAAANRDEIAGGMTSAQISEANRLTSQCQTRQFKGC
jgi:TPR repeat protein